MKSEGRPSFLLRMPLSVLPLTPVTNLEEGFRFVFFFFAPFSSCKEAVLLVAKSEENTFSRWVRLCGSLCPSPLSLGEGVFWATSASSDTSPEVIKSSPNYSETFTCAVVWTLLHTPSSFSYWISDLPSLLLL